MYGGMKTRSRGRGTAKSELLRTVGMDLCGGNDNLRESVTKDNSTIVEKVEMFAPLNFTIDPSKSKMDCVKVSPRRPALISPAPEDSDGSTKSAVTKKAKTDGPVIPDMEDLEDDVNSRNSCKRRASTSAITSFEPFRKREKTNEEPDSRQLLSNEILGYLNEKGIHVDESILEAASILIQMRFSNTLPISNALSIAKPLAKNYQPPQVLSEQSSSISSSELPDEGLRLAQPEDAQELNSLHCFVRSELLELFTLPGSEDEILPPHSRSDATKPRSGSPVYTGRVGLRCVHCSHLPRIERTGCTMSTFYPKSLSDIYRTVCTWQRVHFRACRHIPDDVKETYWQLKEQDRTRGKTKYWVTSARRMGLVDVNDERGGVRFANSHALSNH